MNNYKEHSFLRPPNMCHPLTSFREAAVRNLGKREMTPEERQDFERFLDATCPFSVVKKPSS